ncbi:MULTISPECIES: stage VI sporulation protein D [unclassified Oceanobacillus]|uniref:stage VI sporulation protein D n=1 Tax=unclassified Oceanobacillus TaxID=2630292 RepID=UPI001BE7B9E9|nr:MULTISPECIES: stage VI sporulation protein D [unclassified Oceanobacillus]MBT2598178.1 stage VI sporulation protein D [Oceanobacillus sp. ISL-74]MBT2651097.1 stage VI sporulation protein D [Oceanobacillus sp. ISL-73]
MSTDSNAFTFELEESLFFEKGQEVEEIRGISLEPEISIHAYEDYILIRGAIELQGEYQKVPYTEIEEETLDFDQIQSKRYVEKIEEINGLYLFSHTFPVEISVPPYRVANLDDVTVQIESFDYELLEEDQLKVYASIDIEGIQQDNNLEAESAREDSEEEDSFSFEIEHPIQEDATVNLERTVENKDENEHSNDDDPDRWKVKSQPLSEYFQSISEVEASPEEEEDDEYVEETDYEVNDDQEEKVLDILDNEESPEDVTYLSDIFRNAEEEQYTKMRLCIVQEDDTIETIAQRFAISPLQLIKHNQLESDFEVNQGQLLYIPPK